MYIAIVFNPQNAINETLYYTQVTGNCRILCLTLSFFPLTIRLAKELKTRLRDFPDITSGAYVMEVIAKTPAAM